MLDLDAWSERAAIMEFDGGLTRFAAETAAARAQGYERHEVQDAVRQRHSEGGGDQRQAPRRDAAGNVPGVLAPAAQKDRSVSERDVEVGRDRVELLALQPQRGVVL